MGGFGDWW
uniref:Uncharacterized protein n=1 Tax=Arundo donax TaxID=35708 RepID=A0A0A9CXL5_ARUDO